MPDRRLVNRTQLSTTFASSKFLTAALPEGIHPIPSRTRKLSPPGPMVLHGRPCGRVGRRRPLESPRPEWPGAFAFLGHLIVAERRPLPRRPGRGLTHVAVPGAVGPRPRRATLRRRDPRAARAGRHHRVQRVRSYGADAPRRQPDADPGARPAAARRTPAGGPRRWRYGF